MGNHSKDRVLMVTEAMWRKVKVYAAAHGLKVKDATDRILSIFFKNEEAINRVVEGNSEETN